MRYNNVVLWREFEKVCGKNSEALARALYIASGVVADERRGCPLVMRPDDGEWICPVNCNRDPAMCWAGLFMIQAREMANYGIVLQRELGVLDRALRDGWFRSRDIL
jgi:hypothetical protein